VQDELQQTPSTQLFDVHCEADEQEVPLPFLPVPQVWAAVSHTLVPEQSELLSHRVLHTASTQAKLPHETAVGDPQVPEPVHLGAGLWLLLLAQVALPQVWLLGALAQVPPDVHLPVFPQALSGSITHMASEVSAATLLQVPIEPGTLQLLQAPVQVLLQQTPSVQLRPVAQSPVSEQSPPLPTPAPHFPLAHVLPEAHSGPLPVQELKQSVPLPLHTYGAQATVFPTTQLPVPLQVETVVVTPPTQRLAAQTFVESYLRHPPEPLQVPSFPHVSLACRTHVPLGSGPPLPTGEQVPFDPSSAQDWQVPEHPLLQQNPWAQLPLVHSSPAAHRRPFGFLPHELFKQVLGLTHSVEAPQELAQRVPLHL
jgi:hypothetical protein